MMFQVTYMGHSGFAVELDHTVLVFDYYIGEMPAFPPEKNIFVFASHFHKDHFTMEIYDLFRGYPHVKYVLSRDIKHHYNRNYFLRHGAKEKAFDEDTIFLLSGKHEVLDGGVEVRTFKSTDSGVAFLVRAEDHWIYHAGDLNWWRWPDDSPEEQDLMSRVYQGEVNRIAQILRGSASTDELSGKTDVHAETGVHVESVGSQKCSTFAELDAAFVVLDGRMDAEYSMRGFDYFACTVPARMYYPMHFWENPGIVARLYKDARSAGYRDRIVDTPAMTDVRAVFPKD